MSFLAWLKENLDILIMYIKEHFPIWEKTIYFFIARTKKMMSYNLLEFKKNSIKYMEKIYLFYKKDLRDIYLKKTELSVFFKKKLNSFYNVVVRLYLDRKEYYLRIKLFFKVFFFTTIELYKIFFREIFLRFKYFYIKILEYLNKNK